MLYEAETATSQASAFDAIKGRAMTLYAKVKTEMSMAVLTTPIVAKLSILIVKARLCHAATI
jgi:hypothetical protein